MHLLQTILLKKSKFLFLGFFVINGVFPLLVVAQEPNELSEKYYDSPEENEEEEWESLKKELKISEEKKPEEHENLNQQPKEHHTNKAKFYILNKITTHRTAASMNLYETFVHEKLKITLDSCIVIEDLGKKNHAALVEIWEESISHFTKRLFHGWIFKDSPSLSGLEHPVYDVMIVECIP